MLGNSVGTVHGPLTAIDLFCGAGGLTEGFKASGYDVRFALDRDEDSCASYRLNHPEVDIECASITDFTPGQIAERAGGHVDVVIGGPSCQGFSTAGRRTRWVDEKDERNQLWTHMLAVVTHLRPKAFLMENVPGMVYWRDGHFGQVILKEFRQLGYNVSIDILLAADYGVPQRRRRLFIVGVLGDREYEFPSQTHMGGWRRDTLHQWEKKRAEKGLIPHLSVWDAIGDLPSIGDSPGLSSQKYPRVTRSPLAQALRNSSRLLMDHEVQPLSDEYRKLLSFVPAGGTWRDIPPHLLPERYLGMRRTDSTNLLGRLDYRLPSYTITTQFGNVTTGCNTHPLEERSLSVREGARLQTFPDTYKFVGGITSKCRQIGNAVPPVLGSILASSIASAVMGDSANSHHPRPIPMQPGKGAISRSGAKGSHLASQESGFGESNAPAAVIEKWLSARGLHGEMDATPALGLSRSPNLVFKDARVAVFVKGCFWHGCTAHSRTTKSRTHWWAKNIAANMARDAEDSAVLAEDGWNVVQIWEHEDPTEAARRIEVILRSAHAEAREADLIGEAS